MGQQFEGTAVSTIYIGGGTPTWLNEEDMVEILKALKESFHILDSAEISMECNPGTVTYDKLKTYRLYGVNRLSIGLQSANNKELELLGRVHTYERFLHTFDMARKAGFANLNVDIMTGLPGQTLSDLMKTLNSVLLLRPEHISAYSLIIEEGTPFFDRYHEDVLKQQAGDKTKELPDEDVEYQLYKMTQQVLAQHGYVQYEISNYAKPGYECEHNENYWIRKPYLGLGLGAASLIGHNRGKNESDIYAYYKKCESLEIKPEQLKKSKESEQQAEDNACSEIGKGLNNDDIFPLWEEKQELSKQDEMEEFMFLGLRRTCGVSRNDFETCFGNAIESIYGAQLKKLQQEDMLVMEAGQIFLTDQGRDLSNYVLAQFLLS